MDSKKNVEKCFFRKSTKKSSAWKNSFDAKVRSIVLMQLNFQFWNWRKSIYMVEEYALVDLLKHDHYTLEKKVERENDRDEIIEFSVQNLIQLYISIIECICASFMELNFFLSYAKYVTQFSLHLTTTTCACQTI